MKKIDYSDIPPLTREWFKKARRAKPHEVTTFAEIRTFPEKRKKTVAAKNSGLKHWLENNPKAKASVKRGLADAKAGRLIDTQEDFSKYIKG